MLLLAAVIVALVTALAPGPASRRWRPTRARAEAVAVREALEARLERGLQEPQRAWASRPRTRCCSLDDNRQVVWANQATWDLFNGGQPATGQSFIALVRDYELNQALADALAGHRTMIRQAAVVRTTLRIWATPVEGVQRRRSGDRGCDRAPAAGPSAA